MSIEFTIHPDCNLATTSIEDVPKQEDVRDFFDQLLVHPDFECGFNLLADCRARACELNPAFARAFSKEVRNRAKELGPCRWAFVTMKANDFANVRLIGLLTYGSEVEFAPFLNMEEAADWVEVGAADRCAFVESR
jgi:hypothetical protein